MFRIKADTHPLFKAIRIHQTSKLEEKIKQGGGDHLKLIDSGQRNLLQMAAAKGLVKTVLWLLYAGVDVDFCQPEQTNKPFHFSQRTPLFCALDAGQGLITQILLIFGADLEKTLQQAQRAGRQDIADRVHQLTINPLIATGMLIWWLNNYHFTFKNTLINSIKKQINKPKIDQEAKVNVNQPEVNFQNKISRLFELAVHINLRDAALALNSFNEMQVQSDSCNVSANFWIAKSGNSVADVSSGLNEQHLRSNFVRCLRELKKAGEKELFLQHLKQGTPKELNDFLVQPDIEFVDAKLTTKQQNILNAAAFSDKETLQVILPSTQKANADAKYPEENDPYTDFFVVLDWMTSKQNFVGIKTLVNVLGVDAVFKYAFENQKQELFIFTMFYSDRYTYD